MSVWFYPQLLADTLFWKNQKEEAVKIYASIMEQNPGGMEYQFMTPNSLF